MGLINISDTTYLVDLENVGAKALCQHVMHHLGAKYIVFYSESTPGPGTILEQIPETLLIQFVDCKTGGNNAMDFCICAVAGALGTETGKIIKILSDDKGYDSMIYMLQQEGVRISRETTTYQPEPEPNGSPEEKQAWLENLPIVKAIRANIPKRYQDELIEKLRGASSRKQAHEIIQTVVPQKMVADTYKKLKKHIPKEVVR